MSTEQLKAILMEKILYEQDELTLQGLLTMLNARSVQKVKLTDEQRESIAAGLADLKSGGFVTQEELDRQDEQWL